jgi:phage protein U
MIGSLGFTVFETSSKRIRTFSDLKRSGSARWAYHELVLKKPALEFLGPDVEHISLNIKLNVALGVNPSESLLILRWTRDVGLAVPFILDGRPVSNNLWVIESLEETWQHIDNRGRLLVAEADVNLLEYVRPGGGS